MLKSCPSPETLRNYLYAEPSGTQSDLIKLHVAQCQKCEAFLGTISEDQASPMQQWARDYADPRQGLKSTAREGTADGNPDRSAIPSQTIRDYKIMECIGQGGMGAVYCALHQRLNRLVALKVIKSDVLESIEANSRFAREMKLVAQLEHPQIVRAQDAGEHDGQQYFVMEFIVGVDLGKFARRLGPLPVPEACEIIRLAAGALHHAHQNKIVHRDVKPSNFMVTADGSIKLLDLGLAKTFELNAEGSVTTADQAVGTYAYMAPELLYGSANATPSSDVFGLGVTFFQLLSGLRPFERPGSPPLIPSLCGMRPDVDPKLNALIYQMISHSPDARPSSMAEVESQVAAYGDRSDLSSLVAEYYRWNNRSLAIAPSRATPATLIPPPLPVDSVSSRSIVHPPQPSRSTNRRQRAFMLGKISGLLAFVLSLSLLAVFLLPRDGSVGKPLPLPLPPPPPPMGTLALVPHGDVVDQLLKEGLVTATDESEDRSYTLQAGENELPPGIYRLRLNSPEALEQEGEEFLIKEDSQYPLALHATLTRPFQYPTIPTAPHSAPYYHGTINLNPTDPLAAVAFEMSLRVLPAIDESGLRWLVVSTKHLENADNLSEVAYLQFDNQRWQDDLQLDIRRGFIESRSRSISKFLRQDERYEGREALVLQFDPNHDRLASANITGLPKNRLSIHDFLTLFFGVTDLNAASTRLRALRAQLAAANKRFAWLEDVDNGMGPVSCYFTSNRPKGTSLSQYGYSLARRDAELFGFVQLEAKLPDLTALCMLKIPGGPSKLDPKQAVMEANEELKKVYAAVVDPPTPRQPEARPEPKPTEKLLPTDLLPPELANRPFDKALMPSEPSTVTWEGSVTRGDRTEMIEVRLSLLENDPEQGLAVLEIEVKSDDGSTRHNEYAHLVIDAKKYRETHTFDIKHGWIAFDDPANIFEFPESGDIDSLADERLQLQAKTSFNHIGIVDILAMSFDAKLLPASEIGKLRKVAAGSFSGNRTVKPDSRLFRIGQREGFVWSKTGGVGYEFFVSPTVPFGFQHVTLDVDSQWLPYKVNIILEAVSEGQLASGSESILGSLDQRRKAVASNRRRVAAKEREGWRTWSWEHDRTAYKTYGEYGGQFEVGSGNRLKQYVVVANQEGRFLRVERSLLSEEDRAFIDQGRVWELPGPRQRYHLERFDIKTGDVTLRPAGAAGNVINRTWLLSNLRAADQAWLQRLRSAMELPTDGKIVREEWTESVGYARPL